MRWITGRISSGPSQVGIGAPPPGGSATTKRVPATYDLSALSCLLASAMKSPIESLSGALGAFARRAAQN
jgi:hypothetical protein